MSALHQDPSPYPVLQNEFRIIVYTVQTQETLDKLVLVVYDEELAVKGNIKDYIKC